MFERRRRLQSSSDFVQAHRVLRGGEAIPALPGLLAQIEACRSEMQRSRRHREDVEAEVVEGAVAVIEDEDDEEEAEDDRVLA
ncbi:MAG: hypothetical protein REI94_20895 [Moraxellaceae bacterium]|nr:hypothetical protein [Moraxellaceae bacterium]